MIFSPFGFKSVIFFMMPGIELSLFATKFGGLVQNSGALSGPTVLKVDLRPSWRYFDLWP